MNNPDVLFITEGPTKSGEVFGTVMANNESHFLGKLYADAMHQSGRLFCRYWVTSIVLCRATDGIQLPNRLAEREEILSCAPNLIKTVNKINPKSIVFLGRQVEKFYKKEFPEAVHILPVETLLFQGAAHSPWYSTSVRILSQLLTKLQVEKVHL